MARAAPKAAGATARAAVEGGPSWRDGPIRDPSTNRVKLPVSSADGRFVPPTGMACACCGGSRFSRAGEGWCCDTCHPVAFPGQSTHSPTVYPSTEYHQQRLTD